MAQPTPPQIGSAVFVWPCLRTVRDAQRNPVKNADGSVQKKPAHVRLANGVLVTDRTFVTVDLQISSLIRGGNLHWCTREAQREYLAQQQAAQAAPASPVEEKAAEKTSAEKTVAPKADAKPRAEKI